MFQKIIDYSVRNKVVVFVLVGAIVLGGIYAIKGIPLDAVPDITNNQVQVVATSPTLAAEEIEQLITFPIEASMANIPEVVEIRSISRYGLSVVTIVFKESMPQLDARQYVREQLNTVEIPGGLANPELMPITTGLGEIYQYVLQVQPGYEGQYDIMELRTIQDWVVKRQMAGIPGVIEVSSFGGYVKQYEIALDPEKLYALQLTIPEVLAAVESNNENSGGSYIENEKKALYIRTVGRVENKEEIENIVVDRNGGVPIFVRDIATVQLGSSKRFGAMTMDGKGEVVGGITLMLKGSSSSDAIANVQKRVAQIQSALPAGVKILPYLDRSILIGKAIDTVERNLIEGGLIVIFVLVLLLGNWRGGVIVASVIPLSMLFAFIMMRFFDVSANLMSLGAIDFGIVVDGAVIIVEGILHGLYAHHVGEKLSQKQMDRFIIDTSGQIYKSAAFGVLIILVVFVPIMTLTGIEGKMFQPMAMTVSFAILGAMILSLTYVPVVSAIFLKKDISSTKTFADRIINRMRDMYRPSLEWSLRFPRAVLSFSFALMLVAVVVFMRMGGEFIPTLEEGDLAMQMTLQPGSGLSESVKTSTRAEKILLDNFPEVKHVVSKIGTAEVPTDPMAIEDADIMIILKEKDEWVTTDDREELVELMKEKLDVILGSSFEFTQPIQLRFNELMTGAKTDIAIQVFGEDMQKLSEIAQRIATAITPIDGVGDVKVEQTEGLPQLLIKYDRRMTAQYGVSIGDLNTIIQTAYAGTATGQIFENERQFDLVVRNNNSYLSELDLDKLWVKTASGNLIPVSQMSTVQYRESPLQISRDQAKRRINIGVNVRNRDVASLVEELQQKITNEINLPAGYTVSYGGQFENLVNAKKRLIVAVPLALISIVMLLYFTFGKVKDALMIFIAVPLSAIGGVLALFFRGMPFSISAGVGFIALFGVAVLNGIVLISYYHRLREKGETDFRKLVIDGGMARMRPVIMTAAVASLGFLPMALSSSSGAEVQRPLATVVIGGLISSTLLTLIILPVLYYLGNVKWSKALPVVMLLLVGFSANAQQPPTSLEAAKEMALQHHPSVKIADLNVSRQEAVKKQSYDPGAFSGSITYGQINAGVNDYNISLNQPIGNIPGAIAQSHAADMQIELALKDKLLIERELEYKVTDVFVRWVYAGKEYKSLKSQFLQIEKLMASAKLAVEAGEKNALGVTVLRQEYFDLSNRVVQSKMEYEKATNDLIVFTGMEEHNLILPQDFPVVPYAGDSALSAVFYSQNDQRIEVQEQKLKAEKLGYFPKLNVGYFNQELEGVTGFQGVIVGASFPLWTKPQSARVQMEKIALEVSKQQSELDIHSLERWLHRDLKVREELIQRLGGYEKQSNLDPTQIIDQAYQSLEAGQINYFEYVRIVSSAFETQRNIWQTQYLLLKTLNELNYLTK
ncbi:MAG: CusA/CzcA family heavy metal efflux RND transporter [Cyclobacteriaceae bacterium]